MKIYGQQRLSFFISLFLTVIVFWRPWPIFERKFENILITSILFNYLENRKT
jgi:hypothetical protein